MRQLSVCLVVGAAILGGCGGTADAAEWFVRSGASGNGSSAAPFGRIQEGLQAAQPGDTITVASGTYAEALRTVRGGSAGLPIRLRSAAGSGSVIVSVPANVLRVDHAFVTIEGLVFDGQYAAADTIIVNTAANNFTLRRSEVRRSTKDLIDIRSPHTVLIEDCLIHHALNAANGRTDAHGIVAGAVRDLTIRNTEIHTFSGDGVQVDPGRSAPGWNRVTLEGSRIWLAPLPVATNGFPAGTVAGENAVDTKASSSLPRATLVIRDTTASGFRNGLLANMAAFNLKENVDVTVDRVTVFDSHHAFRLRGPTSSTAAGAWVTVKNTVVYNVTNAFRYENNIQRLRVWNSTIGSGVTRMFQAASSNANGLEVRNLLMLGSRPAEASHASNLSVGELEFVSAATHNYQLAAGSVAIDAGTTLSGVTTDRAGVTRPQGRGYDVGAYEQIQQPESPAGELVVHAWRANTIAGGWQVAGDSTAADGLRLSHNNAGVPAIAAPLAQPVHYFELIVPVEQNRPYRLWIRGRAYKNSPLNDSVYVQFSGAITETGSPTYRIGTTSAATVNLEDCDGCGLNWWGWQDNGSGVGVLGPTIQFAQAGPQTIRVQTREDGFAIDQIVLSPGLYLNSAPGPAKSDTTILPES